MNQETLSAKWEEIKSKAKVYWKELTEEDISTVKGKVEELIKVVQKKYGYEKDHATKEVQKFMDKHT